MSSGLVLTSPLARTTNLEVPGLQCSFAVGYFDSSSTIAAIEADESKTLIDFAAVGTSFKCVENDLGGTAGRSLFAVNAKVCWGNVV